jgi:hypothetical protein
VVSSDPVRSALARVILDQLGKVPALRQPIRDRGLLARHQPLVRALMSALFASADWDKEVAAALIPFRLQSFHATPSFERLLMSDRGIIQGRPNVDAESGFATRMLHAYALVLRRYYGIDIDVDLLMVITARDPETGLDRHFKAQFDGRFLTVDAVGEVPPLTQEARQQLMVSLSDPRAMMAILPPDPFVFRGFTVFRALEITDQEILSSIKRDLIERESIVSAEAFQRLQAKLKAFFRRPELEVSFAAIDGDQVFLMQHEARCEHHCIFADSMHYRIQDFAGTLYEKAVVEDRPLFVEDLAALPGRTPVEEQILASGARSLLIAPLHYRDALIGTLELRSPKPGDLNPAQGMMLQEVLPLFSMAVKRGMDELNTRIQAIIQEHCTVIHPAVEWRFRQAALRLIEGREAGGPAELEPIVFENVYPLYALSDIRGSSTERTLAIQADLTTHLQLALEVLRAAHRAKDLPILDEIAYQIEKRIDEIGLGLKSGDELGVLAFVRHHIEPVFVHLESAGGDTAQRIDDYRRAMDPRLGTVYRRRKDFDESLTLINEAISSYLETEEVRAQAMVPHYFEKQKTDGVEWGLYAGASMLESGRFDPIHLRNLRLWQLMTLCRIAQRTSALKSRLASPLETTHLVLANGAPLAIRFRQDEKRFDVDGAYNVRYEVVKKRIDKAFVRGTTERITQVGAIAIVYAQPQEAAEYREYLEYLQARGDLLPGVEDLELDSLQGAEGLRALRARVNMAGDGVPERPGEPWGSEAAAR